ncbi:DMT family transporter [Actibacterium pelagium]|uniref:Membrane protein n=1 Tax=Actibacterium pelagium TaxID=2029103 RepID=A0A917EGJ5_9RHOB|nr:DMT family transporter [Actibacterium pelagium]GGE38210.1 membrane protein [Actibacterium pelagium]
MQSTLSYAIIMLAAGIGVPILAALNAALGQRLGSPVAAAVVLFSVALTIAAVILMISGPSKLAGVVSAPKHLFLAGGLIAFYVLTITWIAPKFGVGNAVFFVLLGQLISAAIIDHFGLMGALPQPISVIRAAGIAVMGLGVFITQLA